MSSSSSSSSSSVLAGQSLADRVNAARYALAGQGVARAVCKATTEEVAAPKKKHLEYLVQCTHEPNVSVPTLANLLVERASSSSNWVVVFKALVTLHHLMCFGNERLSQYLATASAAAALPPSLTGFAGSATDSDMCTFVRRYARYVNAKAAAYRALGVDVARARSPATSLRSASADRILKTLPVLQSLLDACLAFDAHPRDLSNGVVSAAFLLLYRDLIRVFAVTNDGVIALLEKFFGLRTRREAREALDL